MALRHGLFLALAVLPPALATAALPLTWSEGLMESNDYAIVDDSGEQVGVIHQELHGLKGRGGGMDVMAKYEVRRRTVEPDGTILDGKVDTELVFNPATFNMRSRFDIYHSADPSGNSEARVTYTPIPGGIEVRTETQASREEGREDRRTIPFAVDGPLIDQTSFPYFIRGLPLEEGHTFSVTTVNPARESGVEWLKGMVLGQREVAWQDRTVQVWVIETATAVGVTTYHVLPDEVHTLVRYLSPRGEMYQLIPPTED